MFEQQFIERVYVIVLRRFHLFQHVRMATNRPLTEDHHATGQNICPFNGDGNRCPLVSTGQEVALPEHNAFTPGDIHCVDNRLLPAVGTVILNDSRQHGGFFTEHNAVGNQRCRSIHHVGITGNTRQRLFNPFHLTNRDFELTANVSIRARCQRYRFHAAG